MKTLVAWGLVHELMGQSQTASDGVVGVEDQLPASFGQFVSLVPRRSVRETTSMLTTHSVD